MSIGSGIDFALRKGSCRDCVNMKKCRKDFINLKIDDKRWCAGFVPNKIEPVKVIFT